MSTPACCREDGNLAVVERTGTPGGELVRRECRVCGRKHLEARASPHAVRAEGH